MSKMISVIESPVGKLGIGMENGYVTAIKLMDDNADLVASPLTTDVEHALQSYFNNAAHVLSFPVKTQGTPFQEKVWAALQKIPSGKTLTYGQLAKQLQTAPRAIGQACRTNPLLLITPCHRIVSSNGMGGFAGDTDGSFTKAKRWLLEHETCSLSF